MTALETLDLENNELGGTVSPDGGFCSGLVALTRMQCLNVAQCKLHKLPDVVVGFVALRILDLTNNKCVHLLYSIALAAAVNARFAFMLHAHRSATLQICQMTLRVTAGLQVSYIALLLQLDRQRLAANLDAAEPPQGYRVEAELPDESATRAGQHAQPPGSLPGK